MNIDATTGLISWLPTLAQAGNQTVTVRASNSVGQTTQTFTVNVVVSPPVFSSSNAPAALVNTPYSFTASASGTPAPTYSLVSAPAGMTIDSTTGLVSWTPTYAQESAGNNSFTVQATNYSGTATKTFNVAVAPQAPTGLTGTGA